MVERVIHNNMNNNFIPATEDEANKIKFFVQFYSVSRFKQDTHCIKAIVTSHVRTFAPNTKVVATPNYERYKLSSLFSIRSKISKLYRSYILYKCVCTKVRCNFTYNIFTTNSLKKVCEST